MSDIKRECPGCDSWTSAVGEAFRDGDPCPYCGLPAEAVRLIDEARERHVSEDLITRYAAADERARKAETEARRLRLVLNNIQRFVDDGMAGLERPEVWP